MPANCSSPKTVSATLFKATCLELMDEVAARGMELIVTKHGKAVVRICPVETAPPSPLGFMRGTIVHHDDIVSPLQDAWDTSTTDPLPPFASDHPSDNK